MITLQNDILSINIANKGAELQRIFHKHFKLDYLWNADPQYWGKHAPVLFPIVGSLINNTYFFQDQPYQLPRHGFARDKEFTIVHCNDTEAIFELTSDVSTIEVYPFQFKFRIHYTLVDNKLINKYEVENTGDDTMYFSVGGHPAFQLPIEKHLSFEDYFLELNLKETAQRWTLENGLTNQPEPFLENENIIHLNHQLFEKDAIVFKHLRSASIALRSQKSEHGLSMNFDGFPYLGIWSAPNAPFVCLEPWQGITDHINHHQNIIDKEGIISLPANETWTKNWEIKLF